MPNRKVTLVINAKTDAGWRRLPAIIGNNGKVRPGYGLRGGEPTSFKQYRYELRTYEGNRIVYSPAGMNAADAFSAQKTQQEKRDATVKAGESSR